MGLFYHRRRAAVLQNIAVRKRSALSYQPRWAGSPSRLRRDLCCGALRLRYDGQPKNWEKRQHHHARAYPVDQGKNRPGDGGVVGTGAVTSRKKENTR